MKADVERGAREHVDPLDAGDLAHTELTIAIRPLTPLLVEPGRKRRCQPIKERTDQVGIAARELPATALICIEEPGVELSSKIDEAWGGGMGTSGLRMTDNEMLGGSVK